MMVPCCKDERGARKRTAATEWTAQSPRARRRPALRRGPHRRAGRRRAAQRIINGDGRVATDGQLSECAGRTAHAGARTRYVISDGEGRCATRKAHPFPSLQFARSPVESNVAHHVSPLFVNPDVCILPRNEERAVDASIYSRRTKGTKPDRYRRDITDKEGRPACRCP